MQREIGRLRLTKSERRGRRRAPLPARSVHPAPDRLAQPADSFQLALLGAFALRPRSCEAGSLPKKAQGLLAYLAMHRGRPLPREQLANLLWGHSGPDQARRSLRQCVMSVRAALRAADDVLAADGDSLILAASGRIEVDVAKFETLSRSSEVAELEEAGALYRDEFLAGLQIISEPFAEWLMIERRRLASIMSQVLFRLAAARAQAGDVEKAIAAAERVTAFDPLREDGHRLLMQLLATAGRRSAALKQHALCVEILRRDLGIAPEPATAEMAETIRRGGSMPEVALARDVVASARVSRPRHDDSKDAGSSPAIPEKPSIGVLPFSNLSSEPGQDYFADGIVEDISIALGRIPWLFVIASSSAFAFKDRNADVRKVGTELGVRYVLRGSVRRDGSRVRVVLRLTDTSTGGNIWAERFEGVIEDVFSIQDRITTQVAATIAPALQSVEIERSWRKPTENLTAYDLYLQALPRFRTTLAENQAALQLLYKAIELAPSYGAAYAFAARCYQFQRLFGWVQPLDPRLEEGVRLAHLAAEIGKSDSEALWMAGIALAQLAGEIEHGLALIDKSLLLNPNSASAWISSCFVRADLGDTETALEHFARAQRLNPLDSMHHVQSLAAGHAHFVAGRYREAAEAIDKTLNERPTYTPAIRMKLVTCGLLGCSAEGRAWVQRLLAVNPDATVYSLKGFWQAGRRNPSLLAKYLEGLRCAGLPEGGPS